MEMPTQLQGSNAMNNMMKEAMGRVPEQLRVFMEQNENIINLLNEHTKALATIYAAVEAIAKKDGVKLPKPLTEMTIE